MDLPLPCLGRDRGADVAVGGRRTAANCAIYSTALDIMVTANELFAAGHPVNGEDLATITPYITSKIRRFGDWVLDLTPPPAGTFVTLDVTPVDAVRASP